MRQIRLLRFFILLIFVGISSSVLAQTELPDVPSGYHLVKKGDTYYGLARTYQVPLDSLKTWNGESLKLGQTVRVSTKAAKIAANASNSNTDFNTSLARPAVEPTKTAASKPVKPKPVTNTFKRYEEPDKYAVANKEAQRVLVIPFDPYLYFSDADNDIALQSRIPRQNVRYIFRSRLNAFVDPKGFETINLLGGVVRDSVNELNKIYKSLAYSYQDITQSRFNLTPADDKTPKSGAAAWLDKQKAKVSGTATGPVKQPSISEDERKYYGVKVKDPSLFTHFNEHYAVDYYLFINQFEIKTDYNSCLDRTTQNFLRYFLVHYTIYTSSGELIAGNKVRIPYESNVNDVNKIVRDNLSKMAQRIMQDLPRPKGIDAADSATSAQSK